MRNEIRHALRGIGSAESEARQATIILREAEGDVKKAIQRLAENITWEDLQPMMPDNVESGVLYVGHGDEGFYVGQIDEVYNPNYEYKGFMADDGCRYGYKNHYILK